MIRKTKTNIAVLEFCRANPASYNANKALEEAVEFQEVILKLQTKHDNNPKKPDPKEALKEYGDFLYRGLIELATLFPEKSYAEIRNEVSNHIDYKLNKLHGFKQKGQYKGGL